MDSKAEAVAGNGAAWEEAMDEGAMAVWEGDARRSPIIAFDLESDPMGSGEQPTNPANNVTSASSRP